jgi:hypothetical protein
MAQVNNCMCGAMYQIAACAITLQMQSSDVGYMTSITRSMSACARPCFEHKEDRLCYRRDSPLTNKQMMRVNDRCTLTVARVGVVEACKRLPRRHRRHATTLPVLTAS